MTELIWDGKYGANGKKTAPLRVSLPFQTVETVNESAQEREKTRDMFAAGRDPVWRNRLIWGDRKYVLPSLLDEFAGKVNLIYIDPPFNVGADFSFTATIPDNPDTDEDETTTFTKEPSVIEMKAYRDTWGRGLDSYLQWFYETVLLLRELLAEDGSIYVHLDWHVGHYAKAVMDEVFGTTCFRNEVIWKRSAIATNVNTQWRNSHDVLFFFSKSEKSVFFIQYGEYSESSKEHFAYSDDRGVYSLVPLLGSGRTARGDTGKVWKGVDPNSLGKDGMHWLKKPSILQELDKQGRIYWPEKGGLPRLKYYLAEARGRYIGDIWDDISVINSMAAESVAYPTQKPEALLERIIRASSNEGDLVLDCFCGSGTTAAVAEKLNRRWIACDLGRFAIHTTRKRLLSIPGVRPFVVQNLGKYERQVWQASEFPERRTGVPPVADNPRATGVPPVVDNPRATGETPVLQITERHLPHWQREAAMYYVTFRLADSIPQAKLAVWKDERDRWIVAHPEPRTAGEEAQYEEFFGSRLDQWLDASEGSCVLRDGAVSAIVEQALLFFEGDRYDLDAYAIMPNHVHLLVTPRAGHKLPQILHSWKSFTAKEINKARGTTGRVWQDESYDHIVRDEGELGHFRSYIASNPEKAALVPGEYRLGRTGVPPVISQDIPASSKGASVRSGDRQDACPTPASRQQAYIEFILALYHARPICGYTWLHGLKGGRMVHVGGVDAPVALGDITQIVTEFKKAVGTGADAPSRNGVDVLGWDFAFELNEVAKQHAGQANLDLKFMRIPNDVMDKRAVEQGDVRFFELAALAVDVKKKGRGVTLTLADFVIPPGDVPEDVQRAVKHWSQWIDYWAVDWDYRDDTFHNQWQAYRTRQNKELQKKVVHAYEEPGEYTVVVKVIDILGNDTTKTLTVSVK